MTMTEEEEVAKKVQDFERNPPYETRVVAFYDFLGWRSKIGQAGTDPLQIGRLRRMLLRHTRSLGGQQQHATPQGRFSSFSDNIVVSHPVDKQSIAFVLGTLGAFQLASAGDGFLLRGGVTIGSVYHDNVCVFGPGLNRAYELESKVADVPRVIVDTNVLEALGGRPVFVKSENGLDFIDPFTSEFIGILQSLEQTQTEDVYATLGFPNQGRRSLQVWPDRLLKFALDGLKPQIRVPLADKEWNKVAWLYDRIASRLGVPPASSYPRVRPGDVIE
jgi:hypothetical protein